MVLNASAQSWVSHSIESTEITELNTVKLKIQPDHVRFEKYCDRSISDTNNTAAIHAIEWALFSKLLWHAHWVEVIPYGGNTSPLASIFASIIERGLQQETSVFLHCFLLLYPAHITEQCSWMHWSVLRLLSAVKCCGPWHSRGFTSDPGSLKTLQRAAAGIDGRGRANRCSGACSSD